MRNLKALSLFVSFFALARERTFITTYSIENRCVIELEKYTVCRHVPSSFSPELFTGWAVKGLMLFTSFFEWGGERGGKLGSHSVWNSVKPQQEKVLFFHFRFSLRWLCNFIFIFYFTLGHSSESASLRM